jgi:hypothetical protein
MVKIAFWDNGLGERGTSVALYDYALFNEIILGNESIIMYNTTHYSNNTDAIAKFTNRFSVYGVNNWTLVDKILVDTKCDILYIIKAGDNEGQVSRVIKTVVHCVFGCNQPHGNVYASIAPWVPGNNGRYPFVPHMIHLPEHQNNMRHELGIPDDAIVFGRHGGYEQFDIKYVHDIVFDVAKNHPHIFFLFLNTKPFCLPLPNIIHISKIIDLDKKVEFINTCDSMLWARSGGETFGLAIAEFSIKNKPVVLTACGDEAHTHLMKDHGIWYNQTNLYDILTGFNKEDVKNKDWNAYREYSPEKVMQICKKVFIEN